jgi:hypothetical protein
MNGSGTQTTRLALFPIGLGLGGFFAISFLACVLLGLAVPDCALYRPWLQFLPRVRMDHGTKRRDGTGLDPGLRMVDGPRVRPAL